MIDDYAELRLLSSASSLNPATRRACLGVEGTVNEARLARTGSQVGVSAAPHLLEAARWHVEPGFFPLMLVSPLIFVVSILPHVAMCPRRLSFKQDTRMKTGTGHRMGFPRRNRLPYGGVRRLRTGSRAVRVGGPHEGRLRPNVPHESRSTISCVRPKLPKSITCARRDPRCVPQQQFARSKPYWLLHANPACESDVSGVALHRPSITHAN